ncbi:glycoside hydrolase family 97 protein [Hufsiella ginkgonis]|uniref:Glycoside hydrolase family 97 protein n=1 Tax=Hufsiella ginkgonis TaxID=2695274 RepID=A0A7K1Y010_9SPHI|nr:glycoside hydrolase family 97 protein [Hufsiella ginkgonis]MXV16388.1 hypothetical protein [Hufsiella ginkgonis]
MEVSFLRTGRVLLLTLFIAASIADRGFAQDKKVASQVSPDHHTVVDFSLGKQGQLFYRMQYKKRQVTGWSRLGLKTDGPELANGITIRKVTRRNRDESFDWALGEDARIDNRYGELVLTCETANTAFSLITRVYNGSFAFRYVCRQTGAAPVKLQRELTSFNLADTYKIYQYHEESVFRPMPLDSMAGSADLPATLVSRNGLYLSIGEAENRNYTKCVAIKGDEANSVALDFYRDTLYRDGKIASVKRDTSVYFRDSLVTPWRTISCAENAVGLHAFSQLNLKLTTPLTRENPVHILPGKVFRVPISTEGGIQGADFAAKMKFQYIMLDAGWYGAEFRTNSDPTKWIPEIDLPKIISHAKEQGIGVILYVNYVGLRQYLDTILPLYKKWGVSGMKFGFVDGGTQQGLTWLDNAMKKVNDYGFVLNVHDHYKPTGLSRRYPYNLSQEGIRGDENSPDAFHNMVLPFTRYLAGPADFTFCYPNKNNSFSKNLKVSKGQQLALTVVYFDPLQAIFWYGKSQDYDPGDADLGFFRQVPTVWDESRYLQGAIGESVSVARRKGDTWFMGSAAGLNPWKTTISLSFLKKGKTYVASVYDDDGSGGIAVRTLRVKCGEQFPVNLAEKGGQAVVFRIAE